MGHITKSLDVGEQSDPLNPRRSKKKATVHRNVHAKTCKENSIGALETAQRTFIRSRLAL